MIFLEFHDPPRIVCYTPRQHIASLNFEMGQIYCHNILNIIVGLFHVKMHPIPEDGYGCDVKATFQLNKAKQFFQLAEELWYQILSSSYMKGGLYHSVTAAYHAN